MITSLLLSASLLFTPMHLDTYEQRERTIQVEATFYTAKCKGCTGFTKHKGHDVRKTIYVNGHRVIAVDPKYIALGTKVRVQLEDGQDFIAYAADIGGDIKNYRMDVLVTTKKEAYQMGRQSAKLTIIK